MCCRAAAYERIGEYKAALRDLNEFIRNKPLSSPAHFNRYGATAAGLVCTKRLARDRSIVYTRLGDDTAALADLAKAAWLDPSDPDVYHNRALTYRRLVRGR